MNIINHNLMIFIDSGQDLPFEPSSSALICFEALSWPSQGFCDTANWFDFVRHLDWRPSCPVFVLLVHW